MIEIYEIKTCKKLLSSPDEDLGNEKIKLLATTWFPGSASKTNYYDIFREGGFILELHPIMWKNKIKGYRGSEIRVLHMGLGKPKPKKIKSLLEETFNVKLTKKEVLN